MTLLYSFISLGTSPDFKMTSGALELNHQAVFSVLTGGVTTHHDAVYDRSLTQTLTKLKQKMAPYGWTPVVKMEWTLATDISAHFELEHRIIMASYRVRPELNGDQRDTLSIAINQYFKQNSKNTK